MEAVERSHNTLMVTTLMNIRETKNTVAFLAISGSSTETCVFLATDGALRCVGGRRGEGDLKGEKG